MGLDLYHIIPSRKLEGDQHFSLGYFESNPGYLDTYSDFLTEIDDREFDFHILIFPDHETKELVLERSPSYKLMPSLVGAIERLNPEIVRIAEANQMPEESFRTQHIDNLLSRDHGREIAYYSVNYETSSRKIKVLPYEEIGYQRKGMNDQFYEDFKNFELYFEKSAVQTAARYLRTDIFGENKTLKEHFQENFIDNFIEGQSMFFASW